MGFYLEMEYLEIYVVKLRLCQYTNGPMRDSEHLKTEKYTLRMPRDKEGKDWSPEAANHSMPRLQANH